MYDTVAGLVVDIDDFRPLIVLISPTFLKDLITDANGTRFFQVCHYDPLRAFQLFAKDLSVFYRVIQQDELQVFDTAKDFVRDFSVK